jgi:hypothetical protein
MKPTDYKAPSGYRSPSVKALVAALNITPEKAATVRGLIRGEVRTRDETLFPRSNAHFSRCYNTPSRVERIMECLNECLEMHGIETIGEVRTYGPPAEYLNAGDSYTPTIVFDRMADNFKLTSWADWLETNERKAAFRNW